MNGAEYDRARHDQSLFSFGARAAVLKARAIEAIKCPMFAAEIMHDLPTTAKDKADVESKFNIKMQTEWSEYNKIISWQKAHHQCQRVIWNAEHQNLSGKHGACFVQGAPSLVGPKDNITMWSPKTNPLIAKVACAEALREVGFGDGATYSDPHLCHRSVKP